MAYPYDVMSVHFGSRVPDHAGRLMALAGGGVLTGAGARGLALAPEGVPVVRQHTGAPEAPGLLSPDGAWLLAQSRYAAFTSRVQHLPAPAGAAEDRARLWAAADDADEFMKVALAEDARLPRIWILAIHEGWLKRPPLRAELAKRAADADGLLGLMLENPGDPLASAKAVEGLMDLCDRLRDRLLIFRCDHGALGAYAFGAAGGSIGMSATSRHFTVPGRGGFRSEDPTPRVFWPRIMAWWSGSRFGQLGEDALYDCGCAVCRGASLSRFQDAELQPEADAHNVASWSGMMRAVQACQRGGQREAHWIERCREAVQLLDDLEDGHNILQPPSRQLRAWCDVMGVPVA